MYQNLNNSLNSRFNNQEVKFPSEKENKRIIEINKVKQEVLELLEYD